MCPACLCGVMTAGPDGFRRIVPKQAYGVVMRHCDDKGAVFVGSTECHLVKLPFCAPSLTGELSGADRMPVHFSARHHGPRYAGHLVSQGYCRKFSRPTLQQ